MFLTEEQTKEFKDKGFIVLKGFFDKAVMDGYAVRAADVLLESGAALELELVEQRRVGFGIVNHLPEPQGPEVEPDLDGVAVDLVDRRGQILDG